ncbi:MAG TPA: molecular chaperone DnaK, partial [Lachnospiraceae bacterium]|nr:molecular chaperone DnaK [Lachnospiraceae bacterium]
LGTGKEQHITITAGSSMSDEEIDKAVKEAAEYEAQDKKRKEAIDAKNEAESMTFQVEKALGEVGDKVDAAEKSKVEEEVKNVKDLLEKYKDQDLSEDQVAELKAAQEKMMTSAQGVFTKMYEGMQGQAGPQGAGPDMSGFAGAGSADAGASAGTGAADDIIDGDFKEI